MLEKLCGRGVSLLLLSFLSLLLLLSSAPAASARPEAAAVPESRFAEWPAEVAPLLSERERAAFSALPDDRAREAFIRRFWAVRDPYPETPINEAEVKWNERLAEARQRFGRLDDPRSRTLLVAGPPESSFTLTCPDHPPIEVWIYPPGPRTATAFLLAFLPGAPAHLWHHGEPAPGLASDPPPGCEPKAEIDRIRLWVKIFGSEYDSLAHHFLTLPPVSDDWLASFTPPPPEVAAGRPAETVRLDIEFPGGGEGRTLVRGRLAVPPSLTASAGRRVLDLLLTGEVLVARKLQETFRYSFRVPESPAGAAVPLAFERPLAPGRYTLVVRLEDLSHGRSFEGEQEVAVPAVTARPPEEAAAAPDLRIVAPQANTLTGPVTFAVRASEGVKKVAFSLDGRLLVTRNRPPFEVQLDLGSFPRPHTLKVAGLDASGNEVASDERTVNAGAERFTVKLTEPRRGEPCGNGLHARAEVHLPSGRALDRLELYLGEERVATLYQPPYSLPLTLPQPGETIPLRAVAFLPDGSRAEDLVLVNGPAQGAEMEVRLVDLYATVVDAAGRPVPDLPQELFAVREDGRPQTLRRFERVKDLPLSAAVLLDLSASMTERLPEVRKAVETFFQQVLTPRDRAALLTFDRAPRVAVPWTSDPAALARGLTGLDTEGQTAVWDSVVYALQMLGSETGQRALLVLSDGEDNVSRLRFEQALETARWAGVAIYTIGLDLPKGSARDHLARLAADTGGRAFFLDRGASLATAYGEIERELRSRYLLAYESTHVNPGGDFRAVTLDLGRPGLTARTIRGYYP